VENKREEDVTVMRKRCGAAIGDEQVVWYC